VQKGQLATNNANTKTVGF